MGINLKKKPQILIEGNVMEVHTKNAPFLANTFIGFLAISMFLLPIMSMIMMIKMGDQMRFGLFVGFGFFWFLSFWMTRQFLWNLYGKEVLTFKNRRIYYYSDFKYFQDSRKEIDATTFDVSVLELQEWDEKLGQLVFTSSKGVIELATKVPLKDAEDIVEHFQKLITAHDKA